eukprot:11174718-Lingulodinium_polyedra.AAC.1
MQAAGKRADGTLNFDDLKVPNAFAWYLSMDENAALAELQSNMTLKVELKLKRKATAMSPGAEDDRRCKFLSQSRGIRL